MKKFVVQTDAALSDKRPKTIVQFALKFNKDARSATEADILHLREVGLTDKGVVRLVHLVSDFASYNRLNLVLQTDYDYRDLRRTLAFASTARQKVRGWLADTITHNDPPAFFLSDVATLDTWARNPTRA